jgi:hypothetical protein
MSATRFYLHYFDGIFRDLLLQLTTVNIKTVKSIVFQRENKQPEMDATFILSLMKELIALSEKMLDKHN